MSNEEISVADEKLAAGDSSGIPDYRRFYPGSARVGRRIFLVFLVILLLLGITALVLYLVYRPTEPSFSVIGAAVYQLSTASSPSANGKALAVTIQLTLTLRNPNSRASVLFNSLVAYAAYRGHPITPPEPLPPLLLKRGGAVMISPVLGGGAAVPAAPEVAAGLGAERSYGTVGLRVVLMGRVKYRPGPFQSRWERMYARCDVLVGLGGQGGGASGGRSQLLGEPSCSVDA